MRKHMLVPAASALVLGAALTVVPSASASAPAIAAVRAAITTTKIHTLYIAASSGTPSMPSTVRAGTYYVQVRTTQASNTLQVVLPGKKLTPAAFNAMYQRWYSDYNRSSASTLSAYHSYLTAAARIGGANTVPRSTGSYVRTPGGIGQFAVTLRAGHTYWFYSNTSHIKVVKVTGTDPTGQVVPTVGLLRFGIFGSASVSAPAHLPTHGFIRAIGTPGYSSNLVMFKLLPGITQYDLLHNCGDDDATATKNCYDKHAWYILGGDVSAAANAYWYYSVPAGQYAIGNAGHDGWLDTPFALAYRSIVSIS